MTEGSEDAREFQETPLPRRDWAVLPMVSILSIVLLMGSIEFTARKMFSSSVSGYERCMVLDDPATGVRGIPNATCWEKAPESSWVKYQFNSCGHRTGMECSGKPIDTYRIVMMGSSAALGQYVSQGETIAALLPEQLTQRSGRKIQLYNEGMGFSFSHSTALRFKSVLAAQPDLVLWILTPTDISRGAIVAPASNPDPGVGLGFPEKQWRRFKNALASNSIQGAATEIFGYSKTDLMLRHFLYESQSETLSLVGRGSDSDEGYLKAEPSAAWQGFLQQFERDAADVEGQARSAGAPLAVVLLPSRVQAAMISTGKWPKGIDPYKLNDELRSIIMSRGEIYVSILSDFRRLPNSERLYFPVDGHLNTEGNSVVATLLAKELGGGAIPEIRALSQAEAASKSGNRD